MTEVSPLTYVIVWSVAAFVVFGLLGATIGGRKGRGVLGFFLGAFLGLIGLIVIAVVSPSQKVQRERDEILASAIGRAVVGGGAISVDPLRREQATAEAIRRDPSLGANQDDSESLERLRLAVDAILLEMQTRDDLEAVRSRAVEEAEAAKARAAVETAQAEREARLQAMNSTQRWIVTHPGVVVTIGVVLVGALALSAWGVQGVLAKSSQRAADARCALTSPNADLSQCINISNRDALAGIDGSNSNLSGLSIPSAPGANLSGAILSSTYMGFGDYTNANFTGADFTDGRLYSSNFTGANFTDANLARVDLRDANLTGANLTGADLTGADLSGILYDDQTVWPTGVVPPPSA